jgi:hypothetical protein
MKWTTHEIILGSADDGQAPWYEHPSMGQICDIAVICISKDTKGLAKDMLATPGHDPTMWLDVGDDVFLPGYPLGMACNGHMAIWKRASVASALEFGHSFYYYFYVDTATREGMSGAPCLALSRGRYYSEDPSTHKLRMVNEPFSWRLMGVYSGRKNPSDSFEAQLGIVWRYNTLYDILQNRKHATVQLIK